MLDYDEYNRWIRSSKKTLDSAINDLNNLDFNWSCFKAHQAAEKALKALLWGISSPIIGYSLPNLLNRLTELGIGYDASIKEACMRLNKYYIPTRYPDVWSEGAPEDYYTESEAREAIKYAEDIIKWVESKWRVLSKRGEK